MSEIDYQALRDAAERAMHDDWGYDVDVFHETATPSVVMALLNELESSGKLIETLRQDKDKVIDMSIERVNKLLSRAEAAEKRIAELESALNRYYELPDVYDMAIKQSESLAKSE